MARVKTIEKLTLKEMMYNFELYEGLPESLGKLPLPNHFWIGRHGYVIPENLDDFTNNLCYGQRIFLGQEEEEDFSAILRIMDGYYYPIVTKEKWDADKALLFGQKVIMCKAMDLFPISIYFADLIKQMGEREIKLLHREPSKMELAAGIEKLNIFSDLNALDFLRDVMKITVPEVLLTPYNECLVRFMMAKETMEYQERYFEIQMETTKAKNRGKVPA